MILEPGPVSRRALLALALAWPAAHAAAATNRGRVRILAQGDSLTYGQDTTSPRGSPAINDGYQRRSVRPYPEYLGRLLGAGYTVVNHGYPGDRTVEGLARWAPDLDADVAILMYGTNDALNYGGHPEGTVPLELYRANLEKLIVRQASGGTRIIVIAPPPVADPTQDQRLLPYRRVAAQVARARKAMLVSVPRSDDLWVDGVHFSPAGNARLAVRLVALIPTLIR